LTFPWQLQIGALQIPWHVILETTGIFAGFRYFLFLRKKQTDHIGTQNRIWILIGAIFGSVLGSRLVGGLEDPTALLQSKNLLLHFYQNKTILGGLLGGLAGVELMKLRIGESRSSGDLFTYPIILAMIIGRVGCFSMGIYEETYGVVTNSVFGMDLGDGQHRHPVVLYEIVFLILLWISLYKAENSVLLAEGAKFKIFMICYIVFRLLLDFIKPHYTFRIGLSTIQITCILGLLYYIVYVIKPKKLIARYA
jgi:prolipoprotein diacylglyceryltransferase